MDITRYQQVKGYKDVCVLHGPRFRQTFRSQNSGDILPWPLVPSVDTGAITSLAHGMLLTGKGKNLADKDTCTMKIEWAYLRKG